MCDAEWDWGERALLELWKKMAAVEEEDLLILLSLDDDDLDREIIETVLVKEAEHVEV